MAQKFTKESITTNYKNSGVTLRFDDELDLKLKQYIYLNDNKPNRQNYIIDLIEIITEVPNNLDEYDKEQRSYCYNGYKSIHTGYYIFNDIHYYFIYDSKEETIEIRIIDPNNIKYYVVNDELEEKLLNDNYSIMESIKKKFK